VAEALAAAEDNLRRAARNLAAALALGARLR
jgi:glycerate kinase